MCLIHLLSIHLRHPSVWSGGPSTTSRSSPRSTLSRATFEILLISIPLVVGVVPRSIELGLCVATVWSVGKGRTVAIVSPSESVCRAPVTVHEAPGPAGSAPGHAPAVVVRLAVPGEPSALLGSLLVVSCHLVTLVRGAVVGTNHCLELFLLEIRLFYLVRLIGEALVVTGLVLVLLLKGFWLIHRRNRCIHVEYCLHGLEWSCIDVDSAAMQRLAGSSLEHLWLGCSGK